MPYADRIESLSKEINLFIKNGGNVYSPRRTLPYYNRLRYAVRLYEKETGEKVEYDKVYQDCGINFSRDYYNFTIFHNSLQKVADKDGYVDCIKLNSAPPEQVELRSYINFHSLDVGLTPGEYLVLMTDFRYKNMMVAGNYIDHLQRHFNEHYPNGTVKNLKTEDPETYWKLDHFKNYFPADITYDEALAYFGIRNLSKRKPPNEEGVQINENMLIERIRKTFPDGKIQESITSMPEIYRDVLKLAAKTGQPVSEWFKERDFDYTKGINVARFAKFKVDAKSHETKLLTLKNHYLKDYNLEGLDEVDIFKVNLEIAKKIATKLYGSPTEDEEVSLILSNYKQKESLEENDPLIDKNLQVMEEITQEVTEQLEQSEKNQSAEAIDNDNQEKTSINYEDQEESIETPFDKYEFIKRIVETTDDTPQAQLESFAIIKQLVEQVKQAEQNIDNNLDMNQ